MRIILIRHAQAVPVGAEGVATDFDRHLTAVGRRQAELLADHFIASSVVLDAILCSPFKRTRETAEALRPLLRKPAGFVDAEVFASESHRIEEMVEALAATGGEMVAAVGHMPDIAVLCRQLAGMGVGAFDTAQAVCLRFDGGVADGRGRVEWSFVPSV